MSRHVGRYHLLVYLMQALLATCVLPVGASAQSYWDLTPWRVRVLVAVAAAPELGGTMTADVTSSVAETADRVLGAAWNLEVREADAPLRDTIVHRMASLPDDLHQDDLDTLDKVMVLGIDTMPDGFRVAVRDFDCATRIWSPPVVRAVRQTAMLPPAAFRILLETFAPLARIEFDEDRRVVLRPRAAGLPQHDPSLRWFEDGDVLLPVLRQNDRDGRPKPNGIQVLPWTFLTVEEVRPHGVVCAVHSGLRRPLNTRIRSRIDKLALSVKASPGPTRLLLRDRADPDRPLPGYDVYVRDLGAGGTKRLGRTDGSGAISIEPSGSPLRIVYVGCGAPLLARLPIVPGWKPTVTAHVPDDDVRLRTEGFLSGLQDNLLDLVARREILFARIRHLMETGDYRAAKQHLDQLQRLPNRQRFLQQVTQQQQRALSDDPQVEARMERLFDTTKRLLVDYLDPRKINELQSEYDRARRNDRPGG